MIADRIIIHCSATPNGKHFSAEDIDLWHKQRGFKKCGYHVVIEVDGRVRRWPVCRGLNEQGAHVRGHNKDTIGICLIGTDKFTKEQFSSLRYELDGIKMTTRITDNNIWCHYELNNNKTCPGIRAVDLVLWYTTFDRQLMAQHLIA